MRRDICQILALALALCGQSSNSAIAQELPKPADRPVGFQKDIQPLLQKNCYSCHGTEHQEGGLRLDDKTRALQGGDSGGEIVPGKSAESRLVRMIAGLDSEFGRMPPDGKGKHLTPEEIGLVRAWIDQGATWPDSAQLATAASSHWSLRPVTRPPLPAVASASWLREPLDAFISARLEQENVRPSAPAKKTTLLRRLCLDLTGLPPTPEMVLGFLSDKQPDALERLVDRLLASPHFGERWGRHWLDLARYADSDGYEKDRPRPFAFRFRDWVIDAINADMPFDQFTVEQLAGDLLPDSSVPDKIAAGFHRNTLHNTEGGTDPEEDRVKKTVDRTNTLGTAWLGLTVGCAQCHTHKYDPITQREYYSLYAFFNSLEEKDLEHPSPEQATKLASAKKEYAAKLKQLETAVENYVQTKLPAALEIWEKSLTGLSASELTAKSVPEKVAALLQKPAADHSSEEAKQIADHYRSTDKQLIKLEKAVTTHKAKPPQLPAEAKAQSVTELATPRVTNILLRGDFLSPGDPVQAAGLAVLPAIQPAASTPNRVDLARSLVDPANPLTARVAVNRFWHRLLGRGLVPTLDDFGKQGEKPSHPELLDHLATEFTLARSASEGSSPATPWSVKRLLRRIVLSSTYQQSAAPRRDLTGRDPENVLVARQSRRRVEAEVIRDLALAASGQLTTKIGGPSVRPPQPSEYAALTYANAAKWVESTGEDRYRRGLYTFFQRTSPYPMLMTFDTPDSNECAVARQTSNTPLQALTLWNDPAFFECAQSLGRRIVADVPGEENPRETTRLRSQRVFLVALGRQPTSAESDDIAALHAAALQLATKDEAAAKQLVGVLPLSSSTTLPDLAAWITIGRTILNLDEFITRE